MASNLKKKNSGSGPVLKKKKKASHNVPFEGEKEAMGNEHFQTPTLDRVLCSFFRYIYPV